MCGIAGKIYKDDQLVTEQALRGMLGAIRHRGPDQFGIYLNDHVGLGSARLSIVDLAHGQQPISNEDDSLWIVFNGEIFNHPELRLLLQAKGHCFKTASDTEVILHLYEEYGADCLKKLNGQFAIAIWDNVRKELFLARDRLGVRPLFYTETDNGLIFGSEIKALLSTGEISAALDPIALDQIFTYWSTLSPRTVFQSIFELPPGHYLTFSQGDLAVVRYWEPTFVPEAAASARMSDAEYLEQFSDLLASATKIRLRADVPVGAYLSGGLDSSTIAALIQMHGSGRLDTFSIAFSDEQFDESSFQRCMAQHLGTEHQVVRATHADIGRVFPDVIWHTEAPVMRTSPAPMFLLSRLVRQKQYKVVLTGEGADEFLGGYDIFKENAVRRFWARRVNSKWRHRLLEKLYPDIKSLPQSGAAFAAAFFGKGLEEVAAWDYSHRIRWRNNQRTRRFFSPELQERIKNTSAPGHFQCSPEFKQWGSLERAQYLEIKIFLSQYLLSSQGDRMGMAHSVEGRFPFLDTRLVDFALRLPSHLKLRGLSEKVLLKRLGKRLLPPLIWSRSKRPYRAPIHRSFFNDATEEYVRALLAPRAIAQAGLFKPGAVAQLIRKLESGGTLGETDDMALAGIISSQLVHHLFVDDFKAPPPISQEDDIKVCIQGHSRREL